MCEAEGEQRSFTERTDSEGSLSGSSCEGEDMAAVGRNMRTRSPPSAGLNSAVRNDPDCCADHRLELRRPGAGTVSRSTARTSPTGISHADHPVLTNGKEFETCFKS